MCLSTAYVANNEQINIVYKLVIDYSECFVPEVPPRTVTVEQTRSLCQSGLGHFSGTLSILKIY